MPLYPAPGTGPLSVNPNDWVRDKMAAALQWVDDDPHLSQSTELDQSHRYGRPQAACREPAGSYDKTTRTAICFEHKTQYLLIRAPYTRIVVFWHISNISSIGRPFRPPLWWWWKMTALPLPAANLDDLISGSANEVIQDGGRKRKGRHFPPPPQWGSKRPPQVLVDVISGAAILESRWRRHK